MSQYNELDSRIVAAIRHGRSPLYCGNVDQEARRIASATGRDTFRVVDLRLQALRKAGKIRFLTKRNAPGGVGGWYLTQVKEAS